MTVIKRDKIVPFTAEQMYELVNRIEDYPKFLPWCSASNVLVRTEDEVKAELTLAKSGIEKSFTTLNRMQKNKMIEVRLVSGPFKQLEGFWRFEALDEKSCRVTLDLEFEFSNFLVGLALGPVFTQVTNMLVDAFSAHAEITYAET